MRKFVGLAITIALLSFSCSAYGAVAVSDEYADKERYVGEASNIKIEGQNVSFDDSQITILANGHKNDVTTQQRVSNILAAQLAFGVINVTGEYADNRQVAIANGTPGQMLTIQMSSKIGGYLVITDDGISSGVFTMTKTGWDDIRLNMAGGFPESVTLLYVDDVYGWVIIGQVGVSVT